MKPTSPLSLKISPPTLTYQGGKKSDGQSMDWTGQGKLEPTLRRVGVTRLRPPNQASSYRQHGAVSQRLVLSSGVETLATSYPTPQTERGR